MTDDPFEKLRLDLDSALSELTASTRARLDGIAVVPPPRVDAVSALRRQDGDGPAPRPEPVEEEAAAPVVDEPAPPLPGSPPVRVRRSVHTGPVRVVVPDAPPVVPVERARPSTVRAEEPAARVRVPREQRVPVPAGRGGGGAGPVRPPVPPRARPVALPPSRRPLRTPPPERPGGRRRVVVAVGVVAVLVLVVAGGFLASRPGPVADQPTASAASDTLPAAPAAAPDPGRLVRVEPQPDGSVQVTQWLAFASPVRSVEVAAPTTQRDDRRLSTASVEGRGVATVQLTGVAAPQVVTFRSATDRVRMRYTVRDAVEVSDRDPQRALVDLPTVSISSEGSDAGPTVVRIAGAKVRGVACGRVLRTVRPCGSEDGRGWSLEKPSVDSTSVLATVDMSR
ncbi:hypothetical protein [Solicola sp. PLA-1-18]|uniref:hypothetical protein n=1 Tax=Solicola sp. PLA-1-18 TaxID=3380532 RepID=UPI003B8111C3